jgi:Tfp pilus assembly protein PilE
MRKDDGYTLVELRGVFTVLGIIAAIAIPSVFGMVEDSKRKICLANRLEIGNSYERFLFMEEVNHSVAAFSGASSFTWK